MMEILNFEEKLPGSSVVAEFSIYFPSWQMTFHKWKALRSKKGHLFIAAPSFSSEDAFGKKSWHPLIDFSKEKKEDFQKKILELLEPLMNRPVNF